MQQPDEDTNGVRNRSGNRALQRSALWSSSRFANRPTRVTLGVLAMVLVGLAFSILALARGSVWGIWTCSGAVALIILAIGFRNPLGAPIAFGSLVAIYVGGLWDTPFRGTIALLASVSALWATHCFWRRDNEVAPGVLR